MPAGQVVKIGPYAIRLLVDGVLSSPISALTHPDEASRELAITRWVEPTYTVNVNSFLLDGPHGPLLIDAGGGERCGPDCGRVPALLGELDLAAGQVKAVFLTHLDDDHSLGLIEGESARYPKAVLHVPRRELDYFGNPTNVDDTPPDMRGAFDNLLLLQAAYAGRLLPIDGGQVVYGVEAVTLPGHTPGHTGFVVRGESETLLLWGDLIHLDALQLPDPAFGFNFDIEPETALRSRRTALDTAAREGWLVAGAHIDGLHRLQRRANGYALA